jgi:hypothetical protein
MSASGRRGFCVALRCQLSRISGKVPNKAVEDNSLPLNLWVYS